MSDTLLVSTRKGLFWVKRNSSGWAVDRVDFLGDNVTLTGKDPRTGFYYAALDHGHFGVKLHRFEGSDWKEIPAPHYPPKPEGVDDKDMWGRPIPWNLLRIWSIEPSGADEPGVLWCGTLPGGLFRSKDNGDSWEMVRSLWDHPLRSKWMGGGAEWPGIHSILVDPRNSKRVWLAVSTGGVWLTEDGGESWVSTGQGMRAEYTPPEVAHEPVAQDVHYLVQCPGAPQRMWVQHHNGIFISSDEGKNFTEVTNAKPSAFGFAVAVHPHNPDMAWFIPGIKDEKRIPCEGKLVVTRTRDGGQSFDVLSEGLPDQHAYDVVYRHGLALDEAGERLAFGSTTGNLWVSENQGDRWANISSTLPPIYAVRFA